MRVCFQLKRQLCYILYVHPQVNCEDNPSNCVNDNISKVLEVYDEETCLETMRGDQEK